MSIKLAATFISLTASAIRATPKTSVTSIPSAASVPSTTPEVSVTPSPAVASSLPLDGVVQFAILALLLAAVTYIRNIPGKELNAARKEWEKKPSDTPEQKKKKGNKLRSIYFQMIALDSFQIILVGLAVAITGRLVLWRSALLDSVILWFLFVFALLFLVFHIWINGFNIIKSVEAWTKLRN
ncbi:MAG: hypothetical protein AAF572_16625 [Cyanobacteria bacterium P01_B01_bin.77]